MGGTESVPQALINKVENKELKNIPLSEKEISFLVRILKKEESSQEGKQIDGVQTMMLNDLLFRFTGKSR